MGLLWILVVAVLVGIVVYVSRRIGKVAPYDHQDPYDQSDPELPQADRPLLQIDMPPQGERRIQQSLAARASTPQHDAEFSSYFEPVVKPVPEPPHQHHVRITVAEDQRQRSAALSRNTAARTTLAQSLSFPNTSGRGRTSALPTRTTHRHGGFDVDSIDRWREDCAVQDAAPNDWMPPQMDANRTQWPETGAPTGITFDPPLSYESAPTQQSYDPSPSPSYDSLPSPSYDSGSSGGGGSFGGDF